jgi:hypothetical protein
MNSFRRRFGRNIYPSLAIFFWREGQCVGGTMWISWGRGRKLIVKYLTFNSGTKGKQMECYLDSYTLMEKKNDDQNNKQ